MMANRRIVGTALAALAVAAACGGAWRARRAVAPAAPAPTEIVLTQSVDEAFGERLAELVRPYEAAHPLVKVRITYSPAASGSPDIALRVMAPLGQAARTARPDESAAGVPFVTSDWAVLAFDREAVSEAPDGLRALADVASARKAEGKAAYGIALPEGTQDMLPFFSPVFFPEGASDAKLAAAAALDAFTVLSDLRFTCGLAPHGCTAECAVTMLVEKRAPFAIVGERRLADVRRALGDRLGVAPIPALPGGAALRTTRTDYGLYASAHRGEAKARVATDVVRYLTTESRARVFEGLGKLPLPLRRPEGALEGSQKHEAALAAVLERHSVAAPEARLEAARAALAPIWSRFADGDMGAHAAADALVAATVPNR